MAAVTRYARCAVACALVGCASLDLSQPIDLVADPSWSDFDKATLAAAAQCWNLQYGTAFTPTAQPDTAQMVYFDYAPIACWDSWGRYLAGEPAHDSVCPIDDVLRDEADEPEEVYATPVLLFTILEHELGHALNIRNVSSDDPIIAEDAVMVDNYGPTQFYRFDEGDNRLAFTAFDGEQLAAANPDFTPQPKCPNVVLVDDPTTTIACACR
jgi:hypothetical protein